MVLLALLVGFALVAVTGAIHHSALTSLSKRLPPVRQFPRRVVTGAFAGLLTLHTAEILGFSAVNALLLAWPAFAGSDPVALGAGDVIYLTGVNFTTLGYTDIELAGPVRLTVMLESLGGFMLLTWSATYLYSLCQSSWQAENDAS